MKRLADCRHEAEVVTAVTRGRWPAAADAALREHVAGCAVCTEVLDVAAAMTALERETLAESRLPAPGQVWWRAQLRARREAAHAAARPMILAQGVGAACALGLIAALVTWQWPSMAAAATAWMGGPLAGVDLGIAAWLVLGVWAVLGPLAIYFAVARE